MKKLLFMFMMIPTLLLMVGCKEDPQADIIVTMYPQYDFARQIVGDKMSVRLLTPPGAEIHDYEPTSKDLVAIKNAKLFIFTSTELNTWVNPATIGGDYTIVLDLSTAYTLAEHDHDHDHDDDHDHETSTHHAQLSSIEDDHDHDHDDEIHFWTDPTTVIQLIEAILEKIIEIDPENETYYHDNAHAYIELIYDLHVEIDLFFQDEHHRETPIYFAGHNALGAFASRYHIQIVSLFESFKPDADLTSAELIAFVNEVRNTGASYIFIEELVNPKTADKIINELKKYNITALELHGYHNVSKEDFKLQVSYADLLERNINYLKLALGESHI